MIPSDFFFGNRAATSLLWILPILILLFIRLYYFRKKSLGQLGDKNLLALTITPRSLLIYWIKCAAFTICLGAAIFALMEPQGNGHYPEEELKVNKKEQTMQRRISQEVILLIDCSGSMAVTDSRDMSRLDYAKDIVDQLVSKLTGQSVSLYVFTSEVTPLSPSTMDYLFVRLMLRQMHLNEGDITGTDIVKALRELHLKILDMPPKRMKRLILISDGGDTALDAMPENEKEKAIGSLLDLFDDASSLNLHSDAIGMGSQKGGIVPNVTFQGKPVPSTLEDELLQRLARRGGGLYLEANASSAPAIADRLAAAIQQDADHAPPEELFSPSPQNRTVIYDRYFQIPLSIALLLLMFTIGWPDTRRRM